MSEFERWQLEQIAEYRRQEAEEKEFESALHGDYSLENIRRVVKDRLYNKQENDAIRN